MGKNLLVINYDLRETRVALIENGIIAELHIERASQRGTLGNIYLGKVTRVLPGMQAAFIDIGLERAAFLHVEDLIRPDDFEAYFSGSKRAAASDEDDAPDAPAVPNVPASPAPRGRATPAAAAPPVEVPSEDSVEAAEAEASAAAAVEPVEAESDDAVEASAEGEPEGSADDADEAVEAADAAEGDADESDADEGEALEAEASADGEEGEEADAPEGDEPAAEGAPVEGVEAGAAPAEGEPAKAEGAAEGRGDARGSRSRRWRGRGRRGRDGQRQEAGGAPREGGGGQRNEGGGGQRGGDRKRGGGGGGESKSGGGRGSREPARVTRSTPIRDVVREGQEVIVQVSKEPIGTKGARVTSHVSLPGRYVVYMPTVEHTGVSKRIGSEKERARLREAIDGMKPPSGGLIVRTVAEGLTKKQLKADVGYLVRLWEDIGRKKAEPTGRPPVLLSAELDLVLKAARDLFSDEIEQIVIDDKDQYARLVRFVEMFMPERSKDVVLYTGDEPIFDAYGIEDEIGRALSRKVPLPSGGYLIIDQAEALTAIDVNTGRFVGKGSKDLEDTLVKTNLEAVEEIAYQLRFRNLGGLIVLDLIDMEKSSNREKVRRRLDELLQKDKAKTTVNRISDLGLIEMTRKRTRESLGRLMHEPCFYCDGTGQLQSKETIAYEILRQIRRDRATLPGYSIVVNAHPAVVDHMKSEEREALVDAERRFMRRIDLVPRKEYHLEQFDLAGR